MKMVLKQKTNWTGVSPGHRKDSVPRAGSKKRKKAHRLWIKLEAKRQGTKGKAGDGDVKERGGAVEEP